MKASRLKKGGAVAGAFFTFLVGWEGMKLVPYKDVVGVWTWCAGETQGPRKPRYTLEECRKITIDGAERYAAPVEACIKRPMPDTVFIAFTSLAYNIGAGRFCASAVARQYNAGNTRAACDAMLAWNKAGGVVWKGLQRRREAERALCLKAADL